MSLRAAKTVSSSPKLGDIPNDVIPKSARYAGVKPLVDSGPNILKIKDKFELSALRYRREEHFRRIQGKHLQKLIGGSEDDLLILDMRDSESYEACHIRGAVNYPATMLSRCMNEFIPEIYANRNKEGKLLVLYDFDERIAVPSGNTFFQKGIDNFVVLTGGLMTFGMEFSDLVVGIMPPIPSSSSSRPGTPRTPATVGRKPRPSSANSVMRTPPRCSTPAGILSPALIHASTPNQATRTNLFSPQNDYQNVYDRGGGGYGYIDRASSYAPSSASSTTSTTSPAMKQTHWKY